MPDTISTYQPLIIPQAPDSVMQPEPFPAVSLYDAAALPDWTQGLPPQEFIISPVARSFFILAAAALLVFLFLNFNFLRSMLGIYVDELLTIRHGRDNIFEDRPAAMGGIRLLLLLLLVGAGGVMLAAAAASSGTSYESLLPSDVGLGAIMVLGLYVFYLSAYSAVGYTFSTDEGRREWIRGFSASMALLAMALALPALAIIFYPASAPIMVFLSLLLFIIAKIAFVVKGFRIFFDKLLSLLYFILYLCTLEIIPIILAYKISVFYMF